MKIIFLDIDGVLNSHHWCKKNHKYHPEIASINPRFVRNLSKIVHRTDAKIVLSSWRAGEKRNKSNYLKKIFKDYGLEIFDTTPRTGMEKGIDIQEWLNHFPNVTNIVIIDDEHDMCHLKEYLVKTNSGFHDKISFWWYFTEGLSSIKVKESIRMLKKPFKNKMANQVMGNVRNQF